MKFLHFFYNMLNSSCPVLAERDLAGLTAGSQQRLTKLQQLADNEPVSAGAIWTGVCNWDENKAVDRATCQAGINYDSGMCDIEPETNGLHRRTSPLSQQQQQKRQVTVSRDTTPLLTEVLSWRRTDAVAALSRRSTCLEIAADNQLSAADARRWQSSTAKTANSPIADSQCLLNPGRDGNHARVDVDVDVGEACHAHIRNQVDGYRFGSALIRLLFCYLVIFSGGGLVTASESPDRECCDNPQFPSLNLDKVPSVDYPIDSGIGGYPEEPDPFLEAPELPGWACPITFPFKLNRYNI